MKLYPRLAPAFAFVELERQSGMSPAELDALASPQHPLQIWPAVGASRVTDDELLGLRQELMTAVVANGYPAALDRSSIRVVDLALARALSRHADLTAAEAGFGDVWSFLSLALAPDVVWWRAGSSTNRERFVGSDLTRHTLARLWWRAFLFTYGLDDAEAGWDLWASTPIGEADLDQIQTRRGGYGRSPKMFRCLVRTYPAVVARAVELGVDRRELWRQAYLRWILRLGAFMDFNFVPEQELTQSLLRLVATLEVTDGESAGAPRDDQSTTMTRDFDALPLGTIVVQLAEAVRAAGEIADDDLCAAFERGTGVPIPERRRDLVRGIAWQGASSPLRYLMRPEGGGWRPGPILPAADSRWGDWTIDSFKRHVGELNGTTDADQLAGELFAGRAGKTVKRIVRAAIREST